MNPANDISAHDSTEALATANSSRRIEVRSGQSADAGTLLPIVTAGVIAGRLLDAAGLPLRAARLHPLRVEYVDGRRTFVQVQTRHGNVTTDDRGDFRIFGLYRGRYFLVAAPPAQWFDRIDAQNAHLAASSFFPGVRKGTSSQSRSAWAGLAQTSGCMPRPRSR